MAEGNSIQQTNPALVEWAGRISLDQIPGLLVFLAARWLTETNAKAKEQNGPPDSAENLLTAGDLAKQLNLPESWVRTEERLGVGITISVLGSQGCWRKLSPHTSLAEVSYAWSKFSWRFRRNDAPVEAPPWRISCQIEAAAEGSARSNQNSAKLALLTIDRRASLVHSGTMQGTLTIRIDATLKQRAEKKAAQKDETLSQVVRRALRNYVSERDLRAGRTPRANSSRKRA